MKIASLFLEIVGQLLYKINEMYPYYLISDTCVPSSGVESDEAKSYLRESDIDGEEI